MTTAHAVLEAQDCRAVIDLDHGGRVASLQVSGWELVPRDGKDTIHWGSYIVAPWTGRLRHGRFSYEGHTFEMPLNAPPHALHGLVLDRPWQVLVDGPLPSQATIGIELEPPWPWHGRLVHSLRLAPDRLESRLELVADEPMPAAMGWHPWFLSLLEGPGGRRLGPIELDVEPALMYAHDEDELPTGELVPPVPRPWDFCFVEMARPPRLHWRRRIRRRPGAHHRVRLPVLDPLRQGTPSGRRGALDGTTELAQPALADHRCTRAAIGGQHDLALAFRLNPAKVSRMPNAASDLPNHLLARSVLIQQRLRPPVSPAP